MTQLLNPNDTGEIYVSAADTAVIPTGHLSGELTENLGPYQFAPPPLRSAAATKVIPIVGEGTVLVPDYDGSLTEEILGYDPGGYPPVPVPIPPTPAPKVEWNDRFAELPTVRPAVPQEPHRPVLGRHGVHRGESRLGWALLGSGLTVLLSLAAVGVSALLGVQW